MRKLTSIALLAGLGVAAAVASATAEAHPYVEVAIAPPGVYAPFGGPYGGSYYAHRPFGYPGYYRFGYGPREFHHYRYFRGGRYWHR